MKSIIISDIHLGSKVCQSKKLKDFLSIIEEEKVQCDELIINGDFFDSLDFRRLKDSHWKILSKMRSIAKSKKTIWIRGNHDGSLDIISHLIGIEFKNEYFFKSGNKKVLVLHGDIFDSFISKYQILTKVADKVYRFIQMLYGGKKLAYMVKRNSKTFLRCSDQVKNKAKSYAKLNNVDIICCGHTHFAEIEKNDSGPIYCNSGCWTDEVCNYTVIDKGQISLFEF